MKRILLLVTFAILLSSTMFAQKKTTRKIYLWDVTLSMKGYESGVYHSDDPEKNIYDKVVDWLIRDIEKIKNPSTEIIVLPFQEKILDVIKSDDASNDSKKFIAKRIREFYNGDVTYTNISGPLSEAYNTYALNSRYNDFVILTDGGQNTAGGNDALNRALDRFRKTDSIAPESFLYYVLLTEKAMKDSDIREGKDIVIIGPGDSTRERIHIALSNEKISYQLKDESKSIDILLSADGNIPERAKMRVFAESEEYGIKIDEVVNVDDNELEVNISYDLESIRYEIPEIYELPFTVELLNFNEVSKADNINLTPQKLRGTLKLINKPYKTLSVKKK